MTTATTIPTMRSAAGAPMAFGYAPPPPTDPETATRNLEAARRYLAAIEGGATGAALAAVYTPDVEQVAYPNRLLPMGATRDLAALLDGAVRGQQVVRAQRYEVRAAHASGDHVVLELLWVATLARARSACCCRATRCARTSRSCWSTGTGASRGSATTTASSRSDGARRDHCRLGRPPAPAG